MITVQNKARGRVSQVHTLTPNFTVVTLKMWAYSSKIAEIGNFWYKFSQKVHTPLSDFFTKFGLGRESQVCTLMPNFTAVALKMWAYRLAPKIAKNCNFWYKFAPKGKFWGSTEKLEHRCTTTNLPACNVTIIVLKITLRHSVSVITNFVIPKRDKQTKKTSYFFVYSRRVTHDPHRTWHGDR